MVPLANKIIDLLKRQNGIFHSDDGVEISLDTDNTIHLVSLFPGYRCVDETIALELAVRYICVEDFIHDFALTHIGDLETLSPEALLKRYQKGEARVFCSADSRLNEYLYFRKVQGRLFATNELNLRHAVPVDLTLPDDWVRYTQNYFLGRSN